MIRFKLEETGFTGSVEFDLPQRNLHVTHEESADTILQTLQSLFASTRLVSTETFVTDQHGFPVKKSEDRNLLLFALGINFSFFLIEGFAGWIGNSMGLVADSLDMFADSIVYFLGVLAISSGIRTRKRVAGFSGFVQMALAFFGVIEVVHRFLSPERDPDYFLMAGVAFLALIANILSLVLLKKSSGEGEHMQASMIFTSNDILANIGVILAAGLVYATGSAIPDLVIGSLVFALVLQGAIRILKLAR